MQANRRDVDLRNDWKQVPSRWGHRLHSMCSYMAMFPPSLPHYFIENCSAVGDLVLDPFSGRGTTALEACLMGRVGIGNDMNDLAYALTKAKVDVPDPAKLHARLSELERDYRFPGYAAPALARYEAEVQSACAAAEQQADWERLRSILVDLRVSLSSREIDMPFYRDEDYEYRAARSQDAGYTEAHHHRIWLFIHPATLHQLVYLKRRLCDDPCDNFIRATVLGIMHGRGRFYLSIPMPNTFSLTPRYLLSYAFRNRLVTPFRDVFSCLQAKLELMEVRSLPEAYTRGAAIQGDVRDLPASLGAAVEVAVAGDAAVRHNKKPRLLVTSPPYLGVIKYGQYNWIRLWFLDRSSENSRDDDRSGGQALGAGNLDRLTDARLDDAHRDLPGYLGFMREAMSATYKVTADDCLAAWVIGDVAENGNPPIDLATAVWENSARPEGWRLLTIIADQVAENRKVTKIWGASRGKATLVDRVLVLSK